MTETLDMLFAAHRSANPAHDDGAPDHRPVAAILCCSDARVPPSVVFDQPAGALFVVRIAGNTPSAPALASLDFAVADLGVDTVVVLGHTQCGAVAAALTGPCPGDLAAVTGPICDVVSRFPSAGNDEIAARNVEATVETLRRHPGPTGVAARDGSVQVAGAVHDLTTGRLRTTDSFVPSLTPTPKTNQSPHMETS